ncbi:ABC transporter substrate-binding protein [Dactylosporangium darangshiense]|uniref:ABC transporter substrate-binding protein n=1 Tax=Dactylosporangium darangshiense TaxID=579108 RepID=UPI003638667C
MKFRAAIAALAVTALTALAGCGDGGGTPVAEDTGPIELRMTIWSANEAHLKLFNDIAAEYKTAHPNVSVRFDPLPFDSYTTTLTTQIAGGNGPDLAWVLEDSAPDFVGSGALVPLDDTLKKTDGYNAEDIAPAATKLWQTGGKLYAYPFSTSPFGMFVNTDLLKQAGQDNPADLVAAGTWTWEKAFAEGAAVNAKTGTAGIVVRDFDYKTWSNLSTVWTGWGAQAWSADGKTWVQRAGDGRRDDRPAQGRLHRQGDARPGRGRGLLHRAVGDDRHPDLAGVAAQGRQVRLGPGAAALRAEGQYSVVGQAGLGVLKKSKHAQAATDFLAFFTAPANSAKLAQYFPPARKSQLNADTLAKTNPLLKPTQLQSVVIDGISSGVVKPSHTGSAEIAQNVRASLDPLWKPDANVKSVLDTVCTGLKPLLSK